MPRRKLPSVRYSPRTLSHSAVYSWPSAATFTKRGDPLIFFFLLHHLRHLLLLLLLHRLSRFFIFATSNDARGRSFISGSFFFSFADATKCTNSASTSSRLLGESHNFDYLPGTFRANRDTDYRYSAAYNALKCRERRECKLGFRRFYPSDPVVCENRRDLSLAKYSPV